ncbi:hypothetical protein ACKFKG_15460 [Phormidesmis sp. 146-35]
MHDLLTAFFKVYPQMPEPTSLLTSTQEDDDSEPPSTRYFWFDAATTAQSDRRTSLILPHAPAYFRPVSFQEDSNMMFDHSRLLEFDSNLGMATVKKALKISFSKVLLWGTRFQEVFAYLQGRSQSAKSGKKQACPHSKLVRYIWGIFCSAILFPTSLLHSAMVFTVVNWVFFTRFLYTHS